MIIKTMNDFQNYLIGVLERSDDHAHNVLKTSITLVALIISAKDENSDIKVYARGGAAGNMLWAIINGKRYAFTFSHEKYVVEVKEDSIQGDVVLTLHDDENVIKKFHEFFKKPNIQKWASDCA